LARTKHKEGQNNEKNANHHQTIPPMTFIISLLILAGLISSAVNDFRHQKTSLQLTR